MQLVTATIHSGVQDSSHAHWVTDIHYTRNTCAFTAKNSMPAMERLTRTHTTQKNGPKIVIICLFFYHKIYKIVQPGQKERSKVLVGGSW